MKEKKSMSPVLYLTQAAVIAAIYVVLTMFIAAFNLANGMIQVRISEALTVLPFFTPAAVPGVVIGCLLSNIFTGCALPDIIFGTLATLIAALCSRMLKKHEFLVTLPPVISNAVIIPFVLKYAYGMSWEFKGVDYSIPFFALTVGVGEIISCCVLGTVLIKALKPVAHTVFSGVSDTTACVNSVSGQ